MHLDVLEYTNHETFLRKPAETVYFQPDGQLPEGTHRLITNMIDTLRDQKALGLAAPQVNEPLRIFVVDIVLIAAAENTVITGNPNPFRVFVNPIVTSRSATTSWQREGCLSFPDFDFEIERPNAISVQARDASGHEFSLHARDMLATVLQHELDHLDGVLFIDRISRLKRELARKKLAREHRLPLPETPRSPRRRRSPT